MAPSERSESFRRVVAATTEQLTQRGLKMAPAAVEDGVEPGGFSLKAPRCDS